MSREIPYEWATLAKNAGVSPSFRAIAIKAGLSTGAAVRLILEGRTTPESVTAVAKALGVPEKKITELSGVATSDLGPWSPPMEAHKLNARQRSSLEELIRAIVQTPAAEEPSAGSGSIARLPTTREGADNESIEIGVDLEAEPVQFRILNSVVYLHDDELAGEKQQNKLNAGVARRTRRLVQRRAKVHAELDQFLEQLCTGEVDLDYDLAAMRGASLGENLADDYEHLGEGSQEVEE